MANDFLHFVRKVAEERKERTRLLLKGGEGSGWFAPPKGTHTAEAKGAGKPKITWNPDDLPPQWQTSMHDKDGLIKPEAVAKGIAKAVKERPSRATHGYTGENAFYLVNDKVVAWNEHSKLTAKEKRQAIPVHSHSGESWESWVKQQGQLEPMQPLNSEDLYIWFKGIKRNEAAAAQALIMADGRMTIMEVLPSSDPAVFKLGRKRLQKLTEVTYAEVGTIQEKQPELTTYDITNDKVRKFAQQYGLRYTENVTWRVTPELKKYGS